MESRSLTDSYSLKSSMPEQKDTSSTPQLPPKHSPPFLLFQHLKLLLPPPAVYGLGKKKPPPSEYIFNIIGTINIS